MMGELPISETIDSKVDKLKASLQEMGSCVVACSGGTDSLLLATVAHRTLPDGCFIAHAISPAVPAEDTSRVRENAAREGWQLRVVEPAEFADENYLSNPLNRCYFCKSNLYTALIPLAKELAKDSSIPAAVLSGANCDDLSEYRPGLEAAREHGIRHPFVEAGMDKSDIRALAESLDLPFADLPASPCLSSRLYTGTRVTPERLAAVQFAEGKVKEVTGIRVVRARMKGDHMLIEVPAADRPSLPESTLKQVRRDILAKYAFIESLELDPEPYRAGRSFQTQG
ncbi:MAG: ATP-dependent sacrificial sulfur transferase LarE [Fidelibacterota bacterium]|nr:MAG: ATP-dependent sacrificial sulfur transferase LarE [Candidatus Neomarinimicrobiota bacterium]